MMVGMNMRSGFKAVHCTLDLSHSQMYIYLLNEYDSC